MVRQYFVPVFTITLRPHVHTNLVTLHKNTPFSCTSISVSYYIRDASAARVSKHLAMVSSNDVQRLFLQAIFSRGFLSEKLAMTLWTKCVEAVKGEYHLKHAVIDKEWHLDA